MSVDASQQGFGGLSRRVNHLTAALVLGKIAALDCFRGILNSFCGRG
jgi:hypothetical protein